MAEENSNLPSTEVLNPFGNAPVVAMPSTGSQMAVVAREVAEIHGMMLMAQQFRRDPRTAMDGILKECTRPALADAAIYEYAKGGQTITGPSIRLAEVLARQWGNIDTGIIEIARGNGMSEAMAQCVDLETRTRHFIRFQVRHWIDTKQGGRATRDDREVYELIANMGARRKRATILAVIPGDVVESALHQCEVTLRTKLDLSKDTIGKMVEAFGAMGVPPEALEKFIQRRLDAITPQLFLRLRKIFNSLKDGMSSVDEWFEVQQKQADPKPQQSNGAQQAGSRSEALKEKMREKAAAQTAGNGVQGDYIHQFDKVSAIAAIKEAGSKPDLEKAWAAIALDYRMGNREVEPDIEDAVKAQREVLSKF